MNHDTTPVWLLLNGIFTHLNAEFKDKQLTKFTYLKRPTLRLKHKSRKLLKLKVLAFIGLLYNFSKLIVYNIFEGGRVVPYSSLTTPYVFDNSVFTRSARAAPR
jgi:hypothetical protein